MITVIVTHYNIPPWMLERCVESVKSLGLDFIIVDDCSSEEYRSSIDRYKDNVKYLDKNIGTEAAMLEGLKTCDTEYIMRLDSDDYIVGYPDVFEGFDAYINHVHYNQALRHENVVTYTPCASMAGVVVKTNVALQLWEDIGTRECIQDLVIYNRILKVCSMKVNSAQYYRYTPLRKGSLTDALVSDEAKMVLGHKLYNECRVRDNENFTLKERNET